jgi:dienelactone hydrolase
MRRNKMRRRPAMRLLTVLAVVTAAIAPADAAIHTETVTYQQGDTELRGYLAYDDATGGRRPGVLVVHEWWGLNDHARESAVALAKEGYIALAVDMYGEGKSTDHPQQAGEWATWIRGNKDVGAARFTAGYDLLASHKLTNKNSIAAIGYCFGGSIVLTMAMNGADLEGVVSFHGGLPTEPAPVEKVTAKILVCHGAADPTISQDQIQTFLANLDAVGADYQFISYGGVKHSFTSKSADERGIPMLAYDADADRRSWNAMLLFFDEIFED